jgi:truncated hemoglobin YjbI
MMGSISERPTDGAVVEGVVGSFITRVRADGSLAPLIGQKQLEELRSLSSKFLLAELRGHSTLTPWTEIRAVLFGLGLRDPEYRAVLSHFTVALFSSTLTPALAARLAARIEWSADEDGRRDGRRGVGA